MEAKGVRIATREDLHYLAAHLREADIKEVKAARGDDIDIDTVLYVASLRSNPCYVWCDENDTPLAAFGFAPLHHKPGYAVPWLLGTDKLRDHARVYIKEGRRVVAELLRDEFDYLFNYVHAENVDSIKFLQLVGFTMHEAAPYGKKGELFRLFDAGDPAVCVNDPACSTLLTVDSGETAHV